MIDSNKWLNSNPPLQLKNWLRVTWVTHSQLPPSFWKHSHFFWCGAYFPHVLRRSSVARIDGLIAEATIPPFIISEFESPFRSIPRTQHICQFKDSVYRLPTDVGISIGSPLGSRIAEVFMSRRDTTSSILRMEWSCWIYRQFLEFLNSFYPFFDFTVEIGGSKLNFIDLILTLRPNMFDFEIYRKATTTDILIYGSSFCPFLHKIAVSIYFNHGLLSISTSPWSLKKRFHSLSNLSNVTQTILTLMVWFGEKEYVSLSDEDHHSIPSSSEDWKEEAIRPLPYFPKLTFHVGEVIKTTNKI